MRRPSIFQPPIYTKQLIIDGSMLFSGDDQLSNVINIYCYPRSTRIHIICCDAETHRLLNSLFNEMDHIQIHFPQEAIEKNPAFRPIDLDKDIHEGAMLTRVSWKKWIVQRIDETNITLSHEAETVTLSHRKFEEIHNHLYQITDEKKPPYNLMMLRLPPAVATTLTEEPLAPCPPIEKLEIGSPIFEALKRAWKIININNTDTNGKIKIIYSINNTFTTGTTYVLDKATFNTLVTKSQLTETHRQAHEVGIDRCQSPENLRLTDQYLKDIDTNQYFHNVLHHPEYRITFSIDTLPANTTMATLQSCDSAKEIINPTLESLIIDQTHFMVPSHLYLAALLDMSQIERHIPTQIITASEEQMMHLHAQLQAHINPEIHTIYANLSKENEKWLAEVSAWLKVLLSTPTQGENKKVEASNQFLQNKQYSINQILQLTAVLKQLMLTYRSDIISYDDEGNILLKQAKPHGDDTLSPTNIKQFMTAHKLTFQSLASIIIERTPSLESIQLLQAQRQAVTTITARPTYKLPPPDQHSDLSPPSPRP